MHLRKIKVIKFLCKCHKRQSTTINESDRIATIAKMVAECAACHKELVVELAHEEDDDVEMLGSSSEGKTVPDDCLLSCGCHFHWYSQF